MKKLIKTALCLLALLQIQPLAAAESASPLATVKLSYIDYIKENPPDDPDWAKYTLIYLNDDDIPELFIDYSTGVEGAVLCTVSDGKVEVVNFSHGYMLYFERKNLCLIAGGHMDDYYERVYAIQNGEFVLLHNGEFGSEDYPIQWDEEDNPIYQYFWDGEEVSKIDYELLKKSVFDESKGRNPYDDACGADEIIDRILMF